MNNKNIRKIQNRIGAATLPVAILAAIVSGCSLRNPSQGTTLQITLPANPQAGIETDQEEYHPLMNDLSPMDSSIVPTSLSDINCYMVNITGPGISQAPNISCPTDQPGQYVGIYAGSFPTGTTTTVTVADVPSGPERTIQLIGLDSTVGCPSLASQFASTGNASWTGISDPYVLSSTTMDIIADATVDLSPAFTPGQSSVFNTCGSSGGLAVYAGVTLEGPVAVTPSVCTPVTLMLTDANGNPAVPQASPITVTWSGYIGDFGNLYNSGGCSVPSSTFTISAGQPGTNAWIMDSNTETLTTASFNSPSVSPSGTLYVQSSGITF